MSKGFFEASKVTSKRPDTSLIPKCGACGLFKSCLSPKMPITGDGKKGILVIAEAPGEEEDNRNEQLVGPAGQLLRSSLSKFDIDLDRDCWKTNALICRPPENRKPKDEEIEYCRPNVLAAVRDLNPKSVLVLGGVAVKSFIGPLYRENPGSISQWVGWTIPLQRHNCWVFPTFHPSFVRRMSDSREGPVIKLWFEKHLEKMAELCEKRPWVDVPDYRQQVRVVKNPEEAAAWLLELPQRGGAASFDYETNMLKPDGDDAEIVSCSVCWRGKETIAFPWVGAAIPAMSRFLRSPMPKIGANTKFEDRWTYRFLGHEVNNWVWDGMMSAHHLDNRDGITSVKFQAFVQLGQEDWGAVVRPYLQADFANQPNRIRELDIRTLLIYNGVDSVVEYHLGTLQKKEMQNGYT